jgi:hypothetical protein
MRKPDAAAKLGLFERLIDGAVDGVPGALLRVGIGFATIPAVCGLFGKSEQDWAPWVGLLTVLLLLRAVPVLIRRVIPFSQALEIIWSDRRQLAKRYDSYQWRKLFWIGLGMAIYTGFSGDHSSSRITVSSLCILAGALGLIRWRSCMQAHTSPQPCGPR